MPSETKNNPNKIIVFVATLICLLLILVPMPEALKTYKPDWSLLLLIFLGIHIPKEFNLGAAFLIGLMVDVSKGSLFNTKKFGPHLKCERSVCATSIFPTKYIEAARASTVESLLSFPQLTGFAATSKGSVLCRRLLFLCVSLFDK